MLREVAEVGLDIKHHEIFSEDDIWVIEGSDALADISYAVSGNVGGQEFAGEEPLFDLVALLNGQVAGDSVGAPQSRMSRSASVIHWPRVLTFWN